MLNLNFRQRFVITIIIFSSLPILAGLLITSYLGTKELRKSIGANFAGLAEQVAHKVDLLIDVEITKIHQIAESEDLRAFFEKKKENEQFPVNSDMHNLLKNNILKIKGENYAFINLLDGEGKIRLTVKENFSNIKIPEFNDSNGLTGVFISDFYFQEDIKEYLFYMIFPVFDREENRVIGFIRVDYLRRFFGPAVEDIEFGGTGHAMLIDSEGEVIICPILPTGEHITDKPLLNAISSQSDFKNANLKVGNGGWVVADNDAHGGINSIVGFSPIISVNNLRKKSGGGLNKPWYSFVRQDPEETYRPIRLLTKYVFYSGFFLITVMTLAGIIISRKLLAPLSALKDGVEIIGKGNLDYRVNINTGDEFEELATEFNIMAEGLKDAYTKGEQLAVLEEREWISREIHDRVAQNLAYLKMQIEILQDSYASISKEEIQKEILEIREVIKETYDDLREIISGFRTKIEITTDFIPNLKNYLEKFSVRSDFNFKYIIEEKIFSLPLNIEISFFRIIQEGLANVRRHSQAKNARLTLENQDGKLVVIIEDDGIGFELSKVSQSKRHLGIEIMQERVNKLKGVLEIDSVPGKGTTLMISIPI